MSDLPQLPGPTGDIRLPGAFGLATDGYTADQMREYATASLASAQQRIAELERALGELVALEDLRLLIRMAEAHPLGTAFEDMSAEYNRRKPAVLSAARALTAREV